VINIPGPKSTESVTFSVPGHILAETTSRWIMAMAADYGQRHQAKMRKTQEKLYTTVMDTIALPLDLAFCCLITKIMMKVKMRHPCSLTLSPTPFIPSVQHLHASRCSQGKGHKNYFLSI